MAKARKGIRGKIMGSVLGLIAGGPVGAAFGLVIGHMHDRRPEEKHKPSGGFAEFHKDFSGNAQQVSFTVGVIVLGAKMAKADGRVTRAEIDAFKRVFRVTPAQEMKVGKLFNRARQSASGYEPYAFQLAQTFQKNRAVLEEVLGGLFIIGASDTAGLSSAEIRFLKSVAIIFGFGGEDFARIAARSGVRLPDDQKPGEMKRRDEAQDSYSILGVKPDTSPEEIKIAYRALIREHHPDRLIAQGLPPEFVATAEEKMKRINVAYDVVCKIKGIK